MLLEEQCQLGWSRAHRAALEDLPHDGRDLRVDLVSAVRSLPIADRGAVGDRDPVGDRTLSGSGESFLGPLPHPGVDGELDRVEHPPVRRRVVGEVRRVDVPARFADLLDQGEPLRGLARETRQVSDDDPARLAGADSFQRSLEARPLERPPAAGQVGEDFAYHELALFGEGPCVALLLLGGDQVLAATDAGDAAVDIDGETRHGFKKTDAGARRQVPAR